MTPPAFDQSIPKCSTCSRWHRSASDPAKWWHRVRPVEIARWHHLKCSQHSCIPGLGSCQLCHLFFFWELKWEEWWSTLEVGANFRQTEFPVSVSTASIGWILGKLRHGPLPVSTYKRSEKRSDLKYKHTDTYRPLNITQYLLSTSLSHITGMIWTPWLSIIIDCHRKPFTKSVLPLLNSFWSLGIGGVWTEMFASAPVFQQVTLIHGTSWNVSINESRSRLVIDPCCMQGRLIETKGIERHVHVGIAAPRFQIYDLQCHSNWDSMDFGLMESSEGFQGNAWEGARLFQNRMMGNLQEIPRFEGKPHGFLQLFPSTKAKPSIEDPPVVPVACASTIQLQKQLKIPMEFRSSRTIPARTPVTRRKGWATPTIKLPRMIVPKWYPGSQSELGISTNLSILNHG